MRRKTQQRIIVLFIIASCFFSAVFFILRTVQKNIVFFYYPREIMQQSAENFNKPINIGGIVAVNSLHIENHHITFKMTDHKKSIQVIYQGILPSLFQEGQNAVVKGYFDYVNNTLTAQKVMVKHDEYYKPMKP